MILKPRWSRKPSVISRTRHRVSARAIGPSNRFGRSSTVPAIRAENTSNPPWPNAWRVAARSRLKIEPRNGAGIDACGGGEPMVVLYLPPYSPTSAIPSMTAHPDLAALGRLKSRIQGLRSKTADNGCTEAEALLAAAKVAELLDRYDLSLTDVEIRDAPCEQREYETYRKKRIPLDACIGAIANFCDCRVWREKNQVGEARYVFFGLRSDIEVAHKRPSRMPTQLMRSGSGPYGNAAAAGRCLCQ